MIAVDTNIVIRFLVGDDARQSEQAVDLFRRKAIFVAKTALLEAEWVLRRGYRQRPSAIAAAFEALIDLPNVTCEDSDCVRQAFTWYQSGMDFADALHLATGPSGSEFVTFDRDMIGAGKRLGQQITVP